MPEIMTETMPETTTSVHMIQLLLDSRELMRSARRQNLPARSDDLGYLLHGQLAALFGDLAPKPFHGRELGSEVEVLGYSPTGGDTLRRQAEDFAEPLALAGLRSLASKPLPATFVPGRRLGFEVRACPVVRKSSAWEDPKNGHKRRAGAEVDAFLAACDRAAPGEVVDRREVYAEWLARQCGNAVRLLRVDLTRFRRVRVFRRTQGNGRRPQQPERPEALLRGELEVHDPEAFSRLLARGVGRHRAFGFGMLKLRPPTAR